MESSLGVLAGFSVWLWFEVNAGEIFWVYKFLIYSFSDK
jgi:hypothetical protein